MTSDCRFFFQVNCTHGELPEPARESRLSDGTLQGEGTRCVLVAEQSLIPSDLLSQIPWRAVVQLEDVSSCSFHVCI